MKRLTCIILALCLALCACSAAPVQTTAPTGATMPSETTPPDVDNDMSHQEEELPIPEEPTEAPEIAVPTESVPVETTLPQFQAYTIRIEDPDTVVYAGPAFRHNAVALIQEAGTYTIVEEADDADGNRWGLLKSGIGWVCLTEPALAPIHADYAEEDFNAFHAYWSEETDYITSIGFTPTEKLTDVQFGLLDWFETESWQMAEVLYTMDELDGDHAFLAQVVFWGDMTTYGISFTDADGAERHYAVSISGRDGSLVCAEYLP